MRKKRFGGMRKKRFGSKYGKTTLSRPITYKFAAPAARAKLVWYSIGAVAPSPGNMATDWSALLIGDDGHITIAHPTLAYMHFGICANDPRDPGQRGYTNSDGAHGVLHTFNNQCNGYDEWMKLYRKSVVTGCKFTVRGVGAVSWGGGGAGAATMNSYPSKLPIGVLSQFSELCPNPGTVAPAADPGNPDNVAALWPAGAMSGIGNPLVKRKEIIPHNIVDDAHNEFRIGISHYKPIKSILGLKTVFGDEGCTGRLNVSPSKVVSANCLIKPFCTDHDGVRCLVLVKATMWVTFSSRRAVAMQAHNAAHL